MPSSVLPETKEKAAEISRRIQNSRPLKADPTDPTQHVSGGFNQKSRPDDPQPGSRDDTSAAHGDGQ